jgi:mRNA-decapping enzyme subunit 2
MTDLSTPSDAAPLDAQNDNNDRNAHARRQAYLDALDEVHTRFVLNVPDSELERADRILFQIEQAWWFYEDFLVDASRPPRSEPDAGDGGGTNDNNDASAAAPMGEPLLPSLSFRHFAEELFEYSPLLRSENFPSMWSQFSVYRKKIGTYGCILLSPDRKFVVLVQLWNSKTHMFPSGKINQGEPASDAAIRETYEETGFDVSCKQGLTAEWKESNPELITWDATLTEGAALTFQEDSGKKRTCYVVPNVPKDFPFGAIARKEVSRIAWHPIDSIPKHSFAVVPFLGQLKSWIRTTAAKGKKTSTTPKRDRSNPKAQRTPSRSKSGTPGRSRPRSRSNGSSYDDNDRLVASGLAEAGDDCRGWSEEDMFRTNEILLGRKITYDGNPHAFAEGVGAHGGSGRESVVDPHAFRVVGGSFLNAAFESPGGIASLAPPPDASKLQPLFRTPAVAAGTAADVDRDGDRELQPFFSDDGVTPWGMVVEDARVGESPGRTRRPETPAASASHSSAGLQETGQDLLKLLQQASGGSEGTAAVADSQTSGTSRRRLRKTTNEAFPTDAQITASSQAEKLGGGGGGQVVSTVISPQIGSSTYREKVLAQYEADMLYIQEWVANLPKPRQAPGARGKPFVLDADAIMAQLEPIFYPNTSTG